jgi:Tfp pilus assembly protein PilF
MTKQSFAGRLAAAAFLVSCFAWTTPWLMADPVAGADAGVKDAVPATTAKGGEQSKEITEAVTKFKERDFDGALKLLKEATKKDENLPPANIIMAEFFSQANIPQGARSALEQAVKDSPNDPEAYIIMGDIAMRERRVTEANLLYGKAASMIAEFKGSAKRKELFQPRILSGMAAVEEASGNWSGSQKQLEAWLALEPKSAAAMQRLARCLFQQKDAEGALKKLKESAKVEAATLTPEAILAQLYQQAGDKENAKKMMEAALAAAPNDLQTRLVAAQWALETGQIEKAQEQAAAAMQIDPRSLEAKILRGVVALFQKDYPAAERYFESAHLQSPRNFAASNNLALALIEQKNDAKRRRAAEYAENNAQQYPKVAEAASTYGWVLYKIGRLDDAEKAFQVAISGGQFSPDTAYYIARLSVDRGRNAQAKQWLEGALKSTQPFAMRQEAQALLDEIKK